MKQPVLIFFFSLIFLTACYAAEEKTTDPNNPHPNAIRRFALVVGANDGGRARVKLRYAVTDAKALIRVLETLGGVLPDDSRLLVEPNRDTLFWEINRLKDRIDRAKEKHKRVEVIVYYSGHSDENHLLLGKDKVSYIELRDQIDAMNADVRIAILDSCASGAFTRLKGGQKTAPFLMDSANDMKGYAFMTSSSSHESSQESDRLKGSYFSHYLTSGLRGAADMTQDGRITLNEAYQFAFNETLAQTEKTLSGPQHPNYNIQMTGTGDVVMTDIRKSSSILRIDKTINGRIFIHNSKQVLVVELNKPMGRQIDLGLESGKYRVINIHGDQVMESRINLPMGDTVLLDESLFSKTNMIDTVARGDIKMKQKQRYMVFKKSGRKMNFYGAYNSKFTQIDGASVVMLGLRFGVTFNKSLSLGFAAFGNGNYSTSGHPAYAGAILEYAFPSFTFINPKLGLLIGAGEEVLLDRSFFILEPEFNLTINFTRLLNVNLGVSYRRTSMEPSILAPWSFVFSIRLGK